MKPILIFFLTLFIILRSSPSMAWNKETHMLTAAIAYKQLKKDNPMAIEKIAKILDQHPAFSQKIIGYQSNQKPGKSWADFTKNLSGEDREMALFMLAARWADDVRNYPKAKPIYYAKSGELEGHESWHFVNYKFSPENLENQLSTIPEPKRNILTAMKGLPLKIVEGPDSNRAKAICWMMHLFGDIHQPLHTVALFKSTPTELIKGDMGGNKLFVKIPPQAGGQNEKTYKLHALWDNLYFDVTTFAGLFKEVKIQAQRMLSNPNLSKEKLPQLNANKTFELWAKKESAPLAVKYAYLGGKLEFGLSEGSAVLVPIDYTTNARMVMEKQIMLAGYRMAEWLGNL